MAMGFEAEDVNRLSIDSNKLSYEIFSMLETNFLFGYNESKLWIPELLEQCPHKNPLRGKVCILSIDGGGMQGIVAGRTLAYLEEALKRKSGNPDARIADYFDVATGTSIGGILTAMLFTDDGNGQPLCRAEDTWKLIAEKGKKMFKLSGFLAKLRGMATVFSSQSIERVLKSLFTKNGRHLTLKDTLKPVLIPCYDLSSAGPFVFSRADALETDNFDFNLWEVCRATAAAPGFFKPVLMSSVDRQTTCTAVDGGLVMNNPTAAAITHVLHNKQEFPFVRGVEDLLVLSVGMGQFDRTCDHQTVKGWGALQWAKPIMKIVGDGLSDTVDHALSIAFRQNRHNYVRIQASGLQEKCGTDIDLPSEENVKTLMNMADNILKQKSMESLPFGGKRMLSQSNAERLDWFAEQLVLEHTSRASRISPTVTLKQQSPRSSLTE
eukprot:Gb_24021 [translate_table: standard]